MDHHGGRAIRVAVVMPVLDDWRSMAQVTAELDRLLGPRAEAVYVPVDDGSTHQFDPAVTPLPAGVDVQVVRLAANQGHQRAIALGLAHVARHVDADMVLVMDSDGEDRPEDAVRLIEAAVGNPGSVICALRAKRSEGAAFRFFYRIYRSIFQFLTGKEIRFGNFCLIPRERLDNILYNPGVWNNLAATLLRARVPIEFLPTDRGSRFFGESRMNFIGLVMHGMSVISVFSDVAIGRIVVLLTGLLAALSACIGVVLGIKLTTTIFVPGYATTVILFLANMLISSLFIGFGVILLLLNARSSPAALPTMLYDHLVKDVSRHAPSRAAA